MGSVSSFPLATTPMATVLASLNFALYKATSATSLAIGAGSKVFTTQAGKDFAVGDYVLATSDADAANYMIGQITAYSGTSLTVNVPASNYIGGSGTFADWTLRLSGPPGATGTTGANGPGYAATSVTSNTIASSGSKTFTTQSGLAYSAGARVRAADAANPSTNYMEGVVTSYSGTTLVFTADRAFGSGTLTNWTINIAGDKGADGAGTGDFSSNTATSVDGEMLLFSGTGGKTGKRSTLTGGLLKSTSGVPAIATAGTDYVAPGTATAFTAHQGFTLATLTDGANISWTVSSGQKAKVTLGGNRTMNAVTGAVEGYTYFLWVIQDATGSRTMTWTTSGAGSFDFGTDGAPTLTTTASKADLLCFEAISIGGTLKLRYAGIKRGFA